MNAAINVNSPRPSHHLRSPPCWLAFALVLWCFSSPYATAGLVNGTVRYEDKLYDYDGMTGYTEYKPVRFAEVEIVESGTEQILGRSTTNLAGHYRILIPSSGYRNLRVRCYARNTSGTINAVVKNNTSQQAIYTAVSSTVSLDTAGKARIDLDVPIGAAAGAFNIFDAAVRAMLFMQPYVLESFPLLTFYWQEGSADGTYYNPYANTIHLLGRTTDPDEFDDDIILHEIGHYVSVNLSRDDSPGGSHTLTGQYPVALTWSEGWAHFFSSAVRNEGWQVDTYYSTFSRWNLEKPSWGSSHARGADNEVAVAAVLWDLYDSSQTPDALPTADDDDLSFDFEETWHLMSRWMKDHGPTELRIFYLGWLDGLVPVITSLYELESIFADRHISYVDDAFEPNDLDSQAPEVLTTGERHFATLTSADDKDWYTFQVLGGEIYNAVVAEIRSGAYAKLRFYNQIGALLGESTNSAIGLPTQLQWSPADDGWLYARIEPANGTQAATYNLSVSGPLAGGPLGGSGPDDYGDGTSDAHQIAADGSQLTGSIETPGDADAFHFSLNQGWIYRTSLSPLSGPNLLELSLYDDLPAIFATASAPGDTSPTEITFYCARAGTYYARVHHADRQSGTLDYSIAVIPLEQAEVASPAVLNLTPAQGGSASSSSAPPFRWAARDLIAYRVRFGRYQGDPLAIVFPFTHTQKQMLVPNEYQWRLLTTLASEGSDQLFWSVSSPGAADSSETFVYVLP